MATNSLASKERTRAAEMLPEEEQDQEGSQQGTNAAEDEGQPNIQNNRSGSRVTTSKQRSSCLQPVYPSEQQQYDPAQSGKLGPITEGLSLGDKLRLWGRRIKVTSIILGILFVVFAVVQTGFFLCSVGQDTLDTFKEGPTRTSSIPAVLGINNDSPDDPSIIEVSNLRGTVMVMVLPAGDGSKAQTYYVGYRLVGDNVSKTTVSISTTKVINGTAIVVHISGQSTTPTLTPNGHGSFTKSTDQ
jgi:hypothetical protein